LADPHGIAIDTKNQVMYVSNYGNFHEKVANGPARGGDNARPNWPVGPEVAGSGKFLPPSIAVYPLKGSGDVAPLRTIQGPATRLNWPAHLAFDEERQELYVANDMDHSIVVFSANANGNVAPARMIKGSRTMIQNPTGITVDLKNKELWVANFGNHTATVYSLDALGDTPPLRVIRSGPMDEPALGIGNPHPIAYDSKREEILVPN
jgi:DNA-binding beta-propeller fold protein YncE